MGQVPRPRCRRSGRRNGPQAECTEPAMSQVTPPTEPGWLPDPSGRYEWRYWDGGWTNRVANSAPGAAALPAAPAAASSAALPPPAAPPSAWEQAPAWEEAPAWDPVPEPTPTAETPPG